MEYRGVEFAVVWTFENEWRWSVRRNQSEKVGRSHSRENAIMQAHRFIDKLIEGTSSPQTGLGTNSASGD